MVSESEEVKGVRCVCGECCLRYITHINLCLSNSDDSPVCSSLTKHNHILQEKDSWSKQAMEIRASEISVGITERQISCKSLE